MQCVSYNVPTLSKSEIWRHFVLNCVKRLWSVFERLGFEPNVFNYPKSKCFWISSRNCFFKYLVKHFHLSVWSNLSKNFSKLGLKTHIKASEIKQKNFYWEIWEIFTEHKMERINTYITYTEKADKRIGYLKIIIILLTEKMANLMFFRKPVFIRASRPEGRNERAEIIT